MNLMVCVHNTYMIQESNRLLRKPPLLGPPLFLPEHLSADGVVAGARGAQAEEVAPRDGGLLYE